eukprot:6100766-Ditylum_brightwellii.AAC.1
MAQILSDQGAATSQLITFLTQDLNSVDLLQIPAFQAFHSFHHHFWASPPQFLTPMSHQSSNLEFDALMDALRPEPSVPPCESSLLTLSFLNAKAAPSLDTRSQGGSIYLEGEVFHQPLFLPMLMSKGYI